MVCAKTEPVIRYRIKIPFSSITGSQRAPPKLNTLSSEIRYFENFIYVSAQKHSFLFLATCCFSVTLDRYIIIYLVSIWKKLWITYVGDGY